MCNFYKLNQHCIFLGRYKSNMNPVGKKKKKDNTYKQQIALQFKANQCGAELGLFDIIFPLFPCRPAGSKCTVTQINEEIKCGLYFVKMRDPKNADKMDEK